MFIALYRWKIKEGLEEAFLKGWHRRTEEIYQYCGSLGSRLHKTEDGIWIGYAQWPDRQTFDAARDIPAVDTQARTMFRECVEEAFPDIYMEVADDLLKTTQFKNRKP